MSDVIVVAIIGLVSGLIGGGGGVAAYFRLRPENRRTDAESGKLNAEAGKLRAETQALGVEQLCKSLEMQGKQIDDMQTDRLADRERITKLEASLDLAQRRITELIFIMRRAGVQLPEWAADHLAA